LDKINDLIESFDIAPYGDVALKTMLFDGSSNRIGGRAQNGMLGTGDGSARWVGSGVADKFKGMLDWITRDSWSFLRKAPSGWGQAIGILGGSLVPIAQQHAWDDIWKGNGNIVERSNRFLGHMFSWDTLTGAGSNLFGGIWDTITSLVGSANDLITDPIGTVEDSYNAVKETMLGSVNEVVDMVETVKDIATNPMQYGGRVFSQFLTTAKELLPNTKGLFDFDNGSNAGTDLKPVDFAKFLEQPDSAGGAVTRWKPLVRTALAQLGLSQSYADLVLHRIEVESGGNPNAINRTDINAVMGHPSQGLMQTIPGTFNAYAGPYRSRGITDPMASIYAGLNYAIHRYGASWPQMLAGNQGYADGTMSASPGLHLVGERGPEIVNLRGGEQVISSEEILRAFNGGRMYEIHIHEAKSENTTQSVIRALQYVETMYGM